MTQYGSGKQGPQGMRMQTDTRPSSKEPGTMAKLIRSWAALPLVGCVSLLLGCTDDDEQAANSKTDRTSRLRHALTGLRWRTL